MTRRISTLVSFAVMALSVSVLVGGAYLWHRSLHNVDLLARVVPGGPRETGVLRGVGSYKGAVLFGSVENPQPVANVAAGYTHGVFPVTHADGHGPSLLHVVPATKNGALGFGASTGELRINLPSVFSFLSPPPRKFEVVYVPYYAFMLLGVVYPARLLVRRKRA